MEILQNVLTILSIAGIPSIVTGFVFTRIMKRLDSDKETRDAHMCMLIGLTVSSMELSEATAISYKNGRCNGEISAALAKAQKTRSEYEEFMTKQCIKNIQ